MAGSLFNKFKEDRVKGLLVRELREMLQVQRETIQLVKQELLSVITVRVKGTWQGNALNPRGLGTLHDVYDSDCDDISSTKAVLMSNLSSYDSDVLFELNKLVEDFGKRFVPQQELFAEQAFWLQTLNPNNEQLVVPQILVKIEAPKELTKLQAKDTTISNLKKQIHSLNAKCNQATVKKDIDEYETINIELEHTVAKLLRENEQLHIEREHLKKTYKELYDSIKKTRVQTKDQCDSLIAQLNQKSVENANLNAQIQEKILQLLH
ncbi:hypothetical protein Tco_0071021 [Tanacetum coccineum]